ncbi:hypothetical protein NONO_c60330 [Nocardia nova SH22a]|uniref:Cyclic-phosphate processing Receiver domain-containing protein n=1 Tax=Nocardia nova SH22a TaxID=1415166 RepID=W5TNR9_9NOCA|nr:cyclic-phosphate processing receiver domain-containing protein [Nocardia nova]AHH20809.1 hypothetical protein NONO_c60330 [Nocardia nova SH22a]
MTIQDLCAICQHGATHHANGLLLCPEHVKSLGADQPRAVRRAAGYHGERARRLPDRMKLFVDDERPAPPDWMLVKTLPAALAVLNGLRLSGYGLLAISLDHDLSTRIQDYQEDHTSRPIVLWMCENDWWPTEVYVHTSNPAGEEWLTGMVRRYAPPGTLCGYGSNFWATCPIDPVERNVIRKFR